MRAALALTLLASAVVLSGCVASPAATPSAVPEDLSALAPTAAVVHRAGQEALDAGSRLVRAVGGQYHLGAASTEPTVGVTQDGALFMTALVPNPNLQPVPTLPFAGVTKGPTVMRSLDKGQTWEDVFPKLPTGDSQRFRTYDPYVYVDVDTGRVFMDDIYPISCGMLSWSDDQGRSWTTNPYACGNGQVNDHQSLVAAKPRALPTVGYDKLVYRCVNNVAYVGCAVSNNGGLAFTPQIPVYARGNAPGCLALHGHLRADAEGRVYLPVANCRAGPTIWVTEDDGRTWDPLVIETDHPSADHEMGLAFDDAGNMFATWNAEGMVFLTSSVDGGRTWAPARNVVAPGVTATMFNAVAAGGVGKVAFAYVGTTIEGGYEGKTSGNAGIEGSLLGQPDAPDWDGATWNAYVGLITDALSEDLVIQTVTANDPADPIARGLCGGTRCNGMNDFIDMVMDGEGRPWVAFVDVCTEACVTDPEVHADEAIGFVGTLRSGPALRGEGVALPVLEPQAKAAPADPEA